MYSSIAGLEATDLILERFSELFILDEIDVMDTLVIISNAIDSGVDPDVIRVEKTLNGFKIFASTELLGEIKCSE